MFRKLVWLPVASLLSACSPLGLVNAVSHVYSVDEQRDISYGSLPRQKLDIYLPRDYGEASLPVILFFYGGSWNSGSRQDYRFVGRRLAHEGYITVVADYRLYPDVRFPDFLNDSALALRKTAELMRSDEFSRYHPQQRITLMGHSAGAYNAAMLALDKRWLEGVGLEREETINGWIGFAGPYDLYPITVEEVKPVFFHPQYPADSNPVDFVENAVVPSLLLVPAEDDLVSPQKNTWALQNKLRAADKKSDAIEITGTNHSTIIGTLSPVLFFKGSSMTEVNRFIHNVGTD